MKTRRRAGIALWLGLACGAAQAQESDLDALQLADRATVTSKRSGDVTAFVEAALGAALQRYGPDTTARRLSLDLQLDKTLSKDWRLSISDRLDSRNYSAPGSTPTVNMLREAYVTWQTSDRLMLDLGRINVRNGVAIGYNPTDYFRAGAVRSVSSIDPASLKRNRLGSVMLRGQRLWDGGSLTALVSPRLASTPGEAPFDPDFGATNNTNRWLLSLGTRIAQGFNPQWILFGEAHRPPQLGINATGLLGDSTVAYAEWSGGRGRSVMGDAPGGPDDEAFRSRLAAGASYTTANKLSLTLEYEYNGAGMVARDWGALSKATPVSYLQYAQGRQEPIARESLFFYGTWQDAFVHKLDLTAMLRASRNDHSRMAWLEARYHWDRADLALQWQQNSGRQLSEFGALPQRRVIQLVVTCFFN